MRIHVTSDQLRDIKDRYREALPLYNTPLEIQYIQDIGLLLSEINALREDMKDMEHYLSVISER